MPHDWLAARPVAHRGLHDAAVGIIENTASAFLAAIAAGCAIELDLQASADGQAMVFHDDALGRLTCGEGRLRDHTAAELQRIAFRAGADRIPTLEETCALVAGRAPLFVEIKSRFDGDRRLVSRAVEVLKAYAGPVALMSFDPDQVCAVRALAPRLARGIVAENRYDYPEWAPLPQGQRWRMAKLLHLPRTRPHFVAYAVRHLPALAPLAARWILGLPLLTWTVRTADDRRRAERWADQMIFEGFRP